MSNIAEPRNSRGLLYKEEQVEQLCVLLFDVHYPGEVERQRPFLIADKGDHWQVDGSWNRDKRLEMAGPVFMSVRKSDARVTDFGMWGIIHPAPAAMRLIEKEEQRQKALGISFGPLPDQRGRILDFIKLMSGGLINSAELARQIAEMLLRHIMAAKNPLDSSRCVSPTGATAGRSRADRGRRRAPGMCFAWRSKSMTAR